MRCGSAPTVSLPTATWRIKSAPTLWRFWPIITRSRFTSQPRRPPSTRYCPNGAAIPIEQRAAAEVTGVAGSFGAVQWAPTGAAVYNPAFDVTPAGLVSGWVLDSGWSPRRRSPPGRLRRTMDSRHRAGPGKNGFPGPGQALHCYGRTMATAGADDRSIR